MQWIRPPHGPRRLRTTRAVPAALLLLSLAALLAAGSPPAPAGEGLTLERAGTEQVYFAHRGKPLLSFGSMSDFLFYATSRDAYDWELWADWQADHGMNHVRAYLPLSFKHMEFFYDVNRADPGNLVFPYEETEPGSRQFDLTRLNDAYWNIFRRQLEYLQERGVIVHLLMWNGWQLRAGERSGIDWDGHFFNPANNVNAFTDHLGGELENRFRLYHSVADDVAGLRDAQRAWFRRIVEATADLDNVYYDLVHEIAESHRDWDKTSRWIEDMALTVQKHSRELQPGKQVIMGFDTGGLSGEQREWIFTRPYFNVLIYGKAHTVDRARDWRIRYKKPYVPQEGWDEAGKYGYAYRLNRPAALRQYLWKMMLARCQQMDFYAKPNLSRPEDADRLRQIEPAPDNYDPRGRNPFEKHALVLREFWDGLTDYPDLWFDGKVVEGPGAQQFVLSSPREAVVYCSLAPREVTAEYPAQPLVLQDLALADGRYQATIVRPDRGPVETTSIRVAGGAARIDLPAFTDDIAVHIVRGEG